MIVCPLCEHQQQQGTVCEVCGKELIAPQMVGVVTETLAELESTSIAGASAAVSVERMAELDDHHAAAVTPAPEVLPELERTRVLDGGQALPAEPLAEMEPTRFAGDGQRTQLSATRACRYCGNVQQGGILCDRCGLRLPGAEAYTRATTANRGSESEPMPCPACSVKGLPGQRCRACGAFIRVPEL